MSIALVLRQADDAALAQAAAHHLETAGVLLVRPVTAGRRRRLLVVGIVWAEEQDYASREADGLWMHSTAYTGALARADAEGLTALWLHTHPGPDASPVPSQHDHRVDEQLREVFTLRTGSELFGSVVVSPRPDDGWTFTGVLYDPTGEQFIGTAMTVGDGLVVREAYGAGGADVDDRYDRNVRAFGGQVQRTLAHLQVAVVGAGGTGSATAEQLIRLGVGHLLLIDPDTLEASNISRVYGSTAGDVGRAKVDVLADHLRRVAPDADITAVAESVTVLAGARVLRASDVIFGCTDDNAGRLVLSRHAYYYGTPVLDCGILLSSDAEQNLTGIDGRVTRIGPGAACLLCRGRIDTALAAAEAMDPDEYQRLRRDGYVPALPGQAPAVVTFTSLVAALSVSELLELIIGYGVAPRPTEVLARLHDRELRSNRVPPGQSHYCDPCSPALMRGDVDPHLDLTWTR